ncbi:MAG: phosphoribosylamine--glycine ligase [Elusimicrobia bacterium]|jgi:phosphoribosylamine--glycine ligase|nr:phosphoribosylamine--glycine ligase [Elusimicrobiota bacterium]
MNVLVIGSGGREHALVWALHRSPTVRHVYCAPGNAGIAGLAECVDVSPGDVPALINFIQLKAVGLTVIGPEVPLVAGLADELRAAGHPVFGPGRAAAQLEGSKTFAKEFMARHGIPTAGFRSFTTPAEALGFVQSDRWPESYRVVKADGLAAGKGVVVCHSREEVQAAMERMMVNRAFGPAGEHVVLEEVLEGEELSVMVLTDGETLLPLPTTQDHKRVFDGDEGPNTGGMGAYGPVPQVSKELWDRIEKEILGRFRDGLRRENLDYRGVIYVGIMMTPAGPKVLEFNVRFGDPETQVLLPLVSSDWAKLFLAAAEARLKDATLRLRKGTAVTVVMASGGYPGDYEKGKAIEGLDVVAKNKNVIVFHSGTERMGSEPYKTAGGRVLAVTGLGDTLAIARENAYAAVQKITFEGAHYRKDIAVKGLQD